MKKINKKVAIGLAGGIAVATAIITAIVLLTKRQQSGNTNEQNHLELYNKIRDLNNFIIDDKTRENNNNLLNQPNLKEYSKENQTKLNEIFDKIQKAIKKEDAVINNDIKKIKSNNKKQTLVKKLENAKDYKERKKIWDEAKDIAFKEYPRDFELDKKELNELIKSVKDPSKKDEFLRDLSQSKELDQIDKIKKDVENEILKQGESDYIKAKKDSLTTKTDAAKELKENQKDFLKDLINNSNVLEKLKTTEETVNNEIAKSKLKTEAIEKLKLLKESNFKKELENKVNDPNATLSDYFNVINTIDNFLDSLKQEAYEAINEVENANDKDVLNDKLAKAKTQKELESVLKEAQNTKVLELAKEFEEAKKLDKEEIKSLINKINDQNKQNQLNNLLDKANTSKEISDIKKQVEGSISPNNLNQAQKEALKNKIDASNLPSEEKDVLKNKVESATNENLENISKEVNDKILENILKQKAKDAIQKLSDSDIKSELTHKLNVANNPKEVYDTLVAANNQFEKTKKETKNAIESLKNENTKEVLNKEFNEANTEDKLKELKAKAESIALVEDQKNRIQDLINDLNSEKDKEGFTKQLDIASNVDELNKIEKEVKDQLARDTVAIPDHLNKQKELLKDRVDASSLDSITQKDNLKNEVDKANDQNNLDLVENKIDEAIKNKALLDATKQALKEKIKNVGLSTKELSRLNTLIDNATSQNIEDVKKQVADALNNLNQDETKQLELDKKELSKLIEFLNYQDTKDNLSKELEESNTKNQLNGLRDKINKAIENEAIVDAKKTALIDQINSANLTQHQKDNLIQKTNTAKNYNQIDKIEKELDNILKDNILRQKAISEVNKLKESENKSNLNSILNNPDSTASDYLEVINSVDKIIKDLKQQTKDEINNLDNESKKHELLSELEKATTQEEIESVLTKARVENSTVDLNKTKELVNKLSNSNNEKNTLLAVLNKDNPDNFEIKNVEIKARELLKKAKEDALAAIKKAKGANEYDSLITKVNDSSANEDIFNETKDKALKLYNDQKELTKQALNNFDDNHIRKPELTKAIENAKNVGVLKILAKSIEALEAINEVNNQDKKTELLNRLDAINENTPNSINTIDQIINDAKLQKAIEEGNEIEIIKAKTLQLPYPGGSQSPAIKEIVAEINKIKNNNSLSDEQKLSKAREIENTFETIKQKINETIVEIEKLSPSAKAVLNNELNNSNLMPTDEFVSLITKINEAKVADKEAAKKIIQGLTKLEDDEKESFKNNINAASVSSYDEISAIVDRAKLIDKKKDLIKKAKTLPYPEGENSQAVTDIIARINAETGDEALTTLEKANEFENIISKIAGEIAEIKNQISSLRKEYEDVKIAFNSADTTDEFDKLKELITIKKLTEQSENKKTKIDELVNRLAYLKEDGNEYNAGDDKNVPAITQIKDTYKDLTGEQLNQKLDEVEIDLERIRTSIATVKNELDKISNENKISLSVDGQTNINLINKLREANTIEEFNELMDLINKAKTKDKTNKIAKIDQLNHLPSELKEQLKQEINNANNNKDFDLIVERATLRDKHEELKKIITLSDYIPADTSVDGLSDKVSNTLNKIYNDIALTTNENIDNKRNELNELKTKINNLRDEIKNLSANEITNEQNTKNDLLNLLATKSNDAGFEEVKITIEKAKLKKEVEKLQYPSNTNATAINDLKSRIDEINDNNSLVSFKQIINALPARIQEIKDMINSLDEINISGVSEEEKRAQIEKRKSDLNHELDRADTDQEFNALKQHINDAKTQSQAEYEAQEKNRLKERVRNLLYPSRQNASAINEIISEIDQSQSTNISDLIAKVDKIEAKVNLNNQAIAEVSTPRQAELKTLLDVANTNEEFNVLEQKIQEAKNADKEEIKQQINTLTFLDNKESYINDLENKSYDQMKEVLMRAKRDDLKARINALPYPNTNALAKRELLVEADGLTTEASIDQKVQEIANLHSAIQNSINTIDNLPYPEESAPAKNNFKNKLNELKEVSAVNGLVPNDWSEKIQTLERYRTATLNPIPVDIREYELKTKLNSMHTPEEANEVAWMLYETKRRRTLSETINNLNNLIVNEEVNQKSDLIAEAEIIPESKKNEEIADFASKMAKLDEIILKAQKQNAKNRVDLISYPDQSSAIAAKDKLKEKIESAPNLETINLLIETNNAIDERMDQLNIEVAKIIDKNRVNNINNMLNEVEEMSDFVLIELEIEKAKAIQSLNDLVNLTQIQRTSLANEIDKSKFNHQIENIKLKAQRQDKKERIKSSIDQIPYPNPSSVSAINSIKTLKEEVEALDTDLEIDSKEAEISNFISELNNKITIANALPYNSENSEAEIAIKDEFNTATSISDLNRILPNTWTNEVQNYKDIIHSHFSTTHSLNSDLDKTYPTRTPTTGDANYSVDELKKKIHLIKKNDSIDTIDGFRHLSQKEKDEFKQKINAVENTLPRDNGLNAIDAILIKAMKLNYSKFVDKLPYPNDDSLAARVNETKKEIKNAYIQPITKNTQLIGRGSLEESLNSINSKINDINNKIRQVHDTTKANSFKEKLADANHTELDALLSEINQSIERQTEQVNRDREAARVAINNLPTRNDVRNNLNSRLIDANKSVDLERIKNEAITERQKLDVKINDANIKLDLLPENNPKRIELLNKINDQNQTYEVSHIEDIIRQAEEEKTLLDLKQEVKNLIDTIQYPNLTSASDAITTLKDEVDALNSTQDVEAKRVEIQAFKQALESKVASLNNLPYPSNSSAEAVSVIREEINSVTSLNDLNRVLPDSWANIVNIYKNSIADFIDNPQIANNTLDTIHPTGESEYSPHFLRAQVHSDKRKESRGKINNLTNLSADEKTNYINKLNTVVNKLPTSSEGLAAMDRIVLDATKHNYNKFIDALPYPSDAILVSNVEATKNEIKSDLVNSITKQSNIKNSGGLEERLNGINTKIWDIIHKINEIPTTQPKHDEFKVELSNANHNELDALFRKVNEFVNGQNAQIELDRTDARNAINRLPEGNTVKNNLNSRLNNAQTSEELVAIKNEAESQKTSLDNTRNQASSIINALPGNNAKKSELSDKLNNNNETNEVSKLEAIKNAADTEKRAFDTKKQEALNKLALLPENNAKRNELTNRLNNTITTYEVSHIDEIIRQAEEEKTLVDLRNNIKAIIDSIPYPNKTQAARAIQILKQDVDNLNNRNALENKRSEIEAFKNLMQSKVSAANNLPYTSRDAEAIAKIKEAFNSATTSTRLNEVLPDSWSAELTKYKNAIANHIPNPYWLNARLNLTHPTRNDGYSVANLKTQIHDTKRNRTNSSIDALSSLTQIERNEYKRRVSSLPYLLPEETSLNQMNAILNEATERNNKKSQAQAAINALPSNNAVKNRLQNELANASNERLVAIKSEAETEKRRVDEIESKRTEARKEIERLPATNNDRNRLLEQLANTSNLQDIQNIKNEATQKLNELDAAKNDAKSQVNTIAYPNATTNEQRNKNNAVNALNNAINNAANLVDIQRLKADNERLKNAVDTANQEINTLLSTNPSRQTLKEELASQTTAAGANAIAEKARQAKNDELSQKKNEIKNEINRLNIPEEIKRTLRNRVDKATTTIQLDDIKSELAITVKKVELGNKIDNLLSINVYYDRTRNKRDSNGDIVFDNNGYYRQPIRESIPKRGIPERFESNRNVETLYNIRDLRNLLQSARTQEDLRRLEDKVNEQKNGELLDLEIMSFETDQNNTTYVNDGDKSIIKTMLYRQTLFEPKENLRSNYVDKRLEISEKIRNIRTVDQYKTVLAEIQKFEKDYRDEKAWIPEIRDRINQNSRRRLADVDPDFNVNVPENQIGLGLGDVRAQANRVDAEAAELRYMKGYYFLARRLKKIDYEYNDYIRQLKMVSGDRNSLEQQKIDANLHNFRLADNIERKISIALQLADDGLIDRPHVQGFINRIIQQEVMTWWVNQIINTNRMSVQQKYDWLDKIAINVDNKESLIQMKDDFINAGFREVLNENNPNPGDYGFPSNLTIYQ